MGDVKWRRAWEKWREWELWSQKDKIKEKELMTIGYPIRSDYTIICTVTPMRAFHCFFQE